MSALTKTSGSRSSAALRARAPLRVSRRVAVAPVRAQQVGDSPLDKVAAAVGFKEGLFGFNPDVELFVGRSAMFGFAAAIVGEFAGKGGALAQLGLETPSPALLAAIGGAALVATGVGAARTASRLSKREMPPAELSRYRSFLGLDKEGDISLAAAAMKGLSPAPAAAAAAAPAAIVAEGEEAAAAAPAAEAAAAAAPASRPAAVATSQSYGIRSDFDYAADVERTNGRWAALGFLAAILVEAATGKGVLMQLIMYGKITGFLGPMSGF